MKNFQGSSSAKGCGSGREGVATVSFLWDGCGGGCGGRKCSTKGLVNGILVWFLLWPRKKAVSSCGR